MAKAPKAKAPEQMSEAELDAALAETEARQTVLEKARWKGKYVKLEKDGGTKLQDNPERIAELEKLGWKRV
jgi:hypothetical protein